MESGEGEYQQGRICWPKIMVNIKMELKILSLFELIFCHFNQDVK